MAFVVDVVVVVVVAVVFGATLEYSNPAKKIISTVLSCNLESFQL
jgi:hypothetical protein